MKSGSGSTKRSHKLSRLLKRKYTLEKAREDHIKYLYVSYRMGGFKNVIVDDLEISEAKEQIILFLSGIQNPHIIFTDRPIGVVAMAEMQPVLAVDGWSPHAYWFPWASGREKLAGTARIILDAEKPLFIVSEHKEFYEHLMRYGILRRSGTLTKFNGIDLPIFQTIRKKDG